MARCPGPTVLEPDGRKERIMTCFVASVGKAVPGLAVRLSKIGCSRYAFLAMGTEVQDSGFGFRYDEYAVRDDGNLRFDLF